jgi:ribosomal protein S18 acetylase RimI-like enzyme
MRVGRSLLLSAAYKTLFVDSERRSAGVGKKLIDWLVAEMKSKGWSQLYWNARKNNYRARFLYDKYPPHAGFVRYVIEH